MTRRWSKYFLLFVQRRLAARWAGPARPAEHWTSALAAWSIPLPIQFQRRSASARRRSFSSARKNERMDDHNDSNLHSSINVVLQSKRGHGRLNLLLLAPRSESKLALPKLVETLLIFVEVAEGEVETESRKERDDSDDGVAMRMISVGRDGEGEGGTYFQTRRGSAERGRKASPMAEEIADIKRKRDCVRTLASKSETARKSETYHDERTHRRRSLGEGVFEPCDGG